MSKDNTKGKIYWHGAFYVVAEAELIDYKDQIQIENEHLLSKEALQVDVLVIKKDPSLQIKKNIGRIFKSVNLLEYKSPVDTLTINDYHKVNGYGFLYAAFNDVDVRDMTLTFVVHSLTTKLKQCLTNSRGFSVTESEEGIWLIEGDTFTTQIIEQSRLSKNENLFLRNLQHDIQREDISQLIKAFSEQGILTSKNRYLQVIASIRPEEYKEAINMDSYSPDLDRVLHEFIQERGIDIQWATQIAKKMLRIGEPLEKIALITDLKIETIKSLEI